MHNCEPEEAVGVICKTAVDSCQDGHWKCDNSPMCIPTAFICDEVVDCADGSDENSEHCDVSNIMFYLLSYKILIILLIILFSYVFINYSIILNSCYKLSATPTTSSQE